MTRQDPSTTKTQPIPEGFVSCASNKSAQQFKQKHTLLSKKVWAAFMTVFISGITIGAMTIQLYTNNKKKEHSHEDHIKMRILTHISDKLNLSAEQSVEAEKIMTKMTTQLIEIKESQMPKIMIIIQSAFFDINKLLNEEQKKEFIEIYKRLKASRSKKDKYSKYPRFNSKDAKKKHRMFPKPQHSSKTPDTP